MAEDLAAQVPPLAALIDAHVAHSPKQPIDFYMLDTPAVAQADVRYCISVVQSTSLAVVS